MLAPGKKSQAFVSLAADRCGRFIIDRTWEGWAGGNLCGVTPTSLVHAASVRSSSGVAPLRAPNLKNHDALQKTEVEGRRQRASGQLATGPMGCVQCPSAKNYICGGGVVRALQAGDGLSSSKVFCRLTWSISLPRPGVVSMRCVNAPRMNGWTVEHESVSRIACRRVA